MNNSLENKKRSGFFSRPKGRILMLVLVYLVFVLINMVVNRLVKRFGLPLYVDNIGTLLGAVLGGYLPGIFVGYVTNIINATADPANMYYAGISVLIAVSATFMAERGMYDRFWKALLTIPVLAFFGGVIGSILTYFIYGPGDLGFWGQIWADFKLDLLDKAITVVAFYLIKLLLPKHSTDKLPLTFWRQKPLTKEQIAQAGRAETKGPALRSKIGVIITVIMIFVAFVTTGISYTLYQDFSIERYKETGRHVASLAAAVIDPEKVDGYILKGERAPDYREAERQLEVIRDSMEYIEYVYVYQIREDGCYVVFDLDTEELEGGNPGDVVPFDESFAELIPSLLEGKAIEPIISDDTYGYLLTDYEPVYNAEGRCVCYACADINMNDVRQSGYSFLAKVISLFSGFLVLILVLCLWLSDYQLIYPIDAMTFVAGEFAYNSEDDLETGVRRLKSLDIATADEIENLYHVLVKTISETVGYIDDVREKGEQITRMQEGLIYIMADLVEGRDKTTGDHVHKTAAYVRLILELMREEGLYPDILTDAYVEEVCNAAPLHDVGKITVSDVILNKPGKLTDEEFAVMKRHTMAGQEIIERAMELAGNTGYLKEAKNVATYHHEWWNGSGYPLGLQGEEIPLSARIMAIADVFDALLSVRSYKQSYSFERSMEIMRDGIGKHFDPVIGQLFVDHEDRVREVAGRTGTDFGDDQGEDLSLQR